MSLKIYTSNNYFYIEDTVSTTLYEGFSKEVLIRRKNPTDEEFSVTGLNNWDRSKIIQFTDVDLTGAPYTDFATFVTWYEENTGKSSPQVGGDLNGFIDYNDTTGSFSLTANTWTDIPNNGLGAFTNKNYLPTGVTELIDTSTGYIDTTELNLGDVIFIRNDFTINPNTNNSQLLFRYELGSGAGLYTLEKIVGRLDSGSGQDYRFSLTPDIIYMGDDNTRLNPIKLQVNCTSNATLTNAGSVITVLKR
jgi:hypothetical protein